MKRLSITLATLVAAIGLTSNAQAATSKHHTTAKKTHCTCQAVKHTAKPHATKKATHHKATKKVAKAPVRHAAVARTSEINPDIPADLRISQNRNANPLPYAKTPDVQPQRRVEVQQPTAAVVPVQRVVQTAPATQTTTVTPVGPNTAKRTVTTRVPVAVETVPVVVPVTTTP